MANKDIPIETLYKFLYRDFKEEQKKNKELHVEIGKEKAYSQELETRIKELEKRISNNQAESREIFKKVKEQEAYKNLKRLMQDLRERLRATKQARDNAICMMNEYRQQLDNVQPKNKKK